jgi:molybdenum cofactor synthesis domain-containing protein
MKASVLTIGTEITSGEIVNSNAAWISQRLGERGYTVIEHVSVRDDVATILSSLKRMEKSDVIIVSGGLGPTSDDITRAVLAKWSAKSLQFSDEVWRELNSSYKKRGLPIREAHKHQCYFPKGSQVLKNPVGTAHGFFLQKGETEVYVLPGPPRELEGMWQKTVDPELATGDALPWTHWTLLGMPESEVAETVEPLIKDLGIEVGYRASVPYVYLKLRGRKMTKGIGGKIDQALGEAIVGRNKEDFAVSFLKGFGSDEILFQDQLTQGFLTVRLMQLREKVPDCKIRIEQSWSDQPFTVTPPNTCLQILKIEDDPFGVEITLRNNRRMHRTQVQLPFKLKVASERGRKSAVELALYRWSQWTK